MQIPLAYKKERSFEKFEELAQYVFSFYKDFGAEDIIKYDERFGRFFLNEGIIEYELEDIIDEYNDAIF